MFYGRLMGSRGRTAFLALIAAQAAHSTEECVFRLYDVFAPARFISGLFSSDLARGFASAISLSYCSVSGVMRRGCVVAFRRRAGWLGSGRCSNWGME